MEKTAELTLKDGEDYAGVNPLEALENIKKRFQEKKEGKKSLRKTALVLQGGGMRGVFGAGVCCALEELGYTKMTMTRAFRELRTILEDEEHLEALKGRRLGDRIKPYLRNPIRRQRYYHVDKPFDGNLFLAGDSALAHYTMMAEPNHTTVCVGGQQWKKIQEKYTPIELDRPEPEALNVEVWRYVPRQLAKDEVADPLSVFLSFEKNSDERVEMALEKMLEDVLW